MVPRTSPEMHHRACQPVRAVAFPNATGYTSRAQWRDFTRFRFAMYSLRISWLYKTFQTAAHGGCTACRQSVQASRHMQATCVPVACMRHCVYMTTPCAHEIHSREGPTQGNVTPRHRRGQDAWRRVWRATCFSTFNESLQ